MSKQARKSESKPTRVDVHLIKLRVGASKDAHIYRIVALAMPGSHVMGFEDVRASAPDAREHARTTGELFRQMTGLPYHLVHGGSDWMLGDGTSTLDAASAAGSAAGRRVPKTFPAYYTRVVKLLAHDPTAADVRMAKIGFRAHIAPENVAAAAAVRERARGYSAGAGGGGVAENTIPILAVQKEVEFEVQLRRIRAGAYEVIRKVEGPFPKWVLVGTIDAQGRIRSSQAEWGALLRSMRRVLVERGAISPSP